MSVECLKQLKKVLRALEKMDATDLDYVINRAMDLRNDREKIEMAARTAEAQQPTQQA